MSEPLLSCELWLFSHTICNIMIDMCPHRKGCMVLTHNIAKHPLTLKQQQLSSAKLYIQYIMLFRLPIILAIRAMCGGNNLVYIRPIPTLTLYVHLILYT